MNAVAGAAATAEDDLRLLTDVAASFATFDPKRVRSLRDAGGAVDREMWSRFAEVGWLSITVPEDLGGAGLGVDAVAIVARRLGYGGFPEPFAAAGVLAPAVLAAARDDERDQRLAAVMAGKLLAGIGWEPTVEVGSDGLTGTSRYLGVGGADGFVVPSRGHEGTALHWVGSDAAGLTVTDERRADGSLSASLVLEGVAEHPIVPSPDGGELLDAALELARVAAAAELVGVAERVMEMTLAYLREREQFGRPIGSFQALQHRCVNIWMQLELATAALDAAVRVHTDSESDRAARAAAASGAKARAAIASASVCRTALQLHGAIGFTEEYELGLFLNRALALEPWLGNAVESRRRHAELVREGARSEEADRVAGEPVPDPGGDWNAMDDEDFRSMVRGGLDANYPRELRYLPSRPLWSEQAEWIDFLIARGWVAPGWPVERGGMGLAPIKQVIFREEHERWGATEYREQGVTQVGPMIMAHGTPEQQDTWLPPIVAGEHHWAQGYSEPEAGSDLASLRCRAVRDGDEYVVNGQKIWTTLAHVATHLYLLVRTDPDAKKQRGISFLVTEIDAPGITVRPITDIAGHVDVCEVFLEDVRIPVSNLIGAENEGWTIAKSLLGHERLTAGSPGPAEYAMEVLASVARARGLEDDPLFLERQSELMMDVAHMRDAYTGFKAIIARGEEIGPEVSMLKVLGTETFAAIADFIIETTGEAGALSGSVALGDAEVDVLQALYKARASMVYAGSNEIQRNIIATAVLGLPRG